MAYLYLPGSGLEVPGVEATLEYGDAAKYASGRIPGALLINDRSKPDQVHVSELSGLHDDPDSSDSRTERAGHWGERAGILMPRGRTVGVTGQVRAGNVGRMRDLWRRTRGQFGRVERDLIIHPPGEVPFFVNEVFSAVTTGWNATSTNGGSLSAITTFTDGFLNGISLTNTYASPAAGDFAIGGTTLGPFMRPWGGEDIWMTAIVRAHAAAAATVAIKLGVILVYYDPNNPGAITSTIVQMTGTGVITSPTTGTYYMLAGRLTPTTSLMPRVNYVMPYIAMTNPATSGAYTLRVAQVSMVLLAPSAVAPLGYADGSSPGFEWEGASGQSRSYGPCYAANQFSDPDCSALTSTWANDSTAGVVVDVAGTVVYGWPDFGRSANSWSIRNPSTTSRTIAVRYPATLADPGLFVVAGGRKYRAHLRLRVSESFTTGLVTIAWLDRAGTVISSSTVSTFSTVAPAGLVQDVNLDAVVTAPSLAVRAYVRIASQSASTVTGDKLTILIAEPRLTDASEFDVGADVAVDSTVPPELGITTTKGTRAGTSLVSTPTGARRRIPRPFLLRKMRALWDGKAPESQRNLQARRDFTMSLRSSDPRIYVLDQVRAFFRGTVAAALNSFLSSTFAASLIAPPTVVASDAFTGTTAGNALNARTAPVGGSWATSGDATDFTFTDDFGSLAGEAIKRATTVSETAGRYAILGSTNYTDVQVDVRARDYTISSLVDQVVIVRWTDANNHIRLVVPTDLASSPGVRLEQVVTGTVTVLASSTWMRTSGTGALEIYRLRLIAYATGRLIGQVFTDAGLLQVTLKAQAAAAATGGTLATGKPGLNDRSRFPTAQGNRYFDDFVVSVPVASPSGPPPNFTFETNTSLDLNVGWKQNSLGAPFPLGGVGLGPSEPDTTTTGFLAQDSLVRMYYSAGSTTYTTPEVTVSGGNITNAVSSPTYALLADSLVGGAWQYNYLGVLLKRVSSTTWIEARFNSANQVAMNAAHGSPTAPFSLELWCSHDAAGSAAVTRLGGWDVPVANILDGHRKHLHVSMDPNGVVYVELWDFGGPTLTDVGLIARQSYTLTAPLSTLLGPTVAGRAGVVMKLARWDDGTLVGVGVGEMEDNYGDPYLSTFEATDYATALGLISCPVIGDVDDVPLQLQLRGSIDSPTIKLANIDTGDSAVISLSGVFTESDPVTIDMDAGTIRSASGLDYFDRRQLGSRFFSLKPGHNFIIVQAKGWDTAAPAHVIAIWRNALK